MIPAVVLTVLVTVGLTALLTRVGPLDMPRARSAHSWPVATGGGLAVIAGVTAGLILFVLLEQPDPGLGRVKWILAGGAVVGLLGSLDDVFDFPPLTKLIVQVALSLGFAGFVAYVDVLPAWPGMEIQTGLILGVLGTALWLVVVMNAYNFMDGSDGLAPGVQAIGLFTLALINPDRPILSFVLLAAGIANIIFIPFNHPARRIFQGDTGALFSSFLIGSATVLQATGTNPQASLYMGVFVAAPFLTDVLLTLLKRARAKRSLFQAHSEHLYQRWVRHDGRTAGQLAWRVWGLTAACSVIGFVVERFAPDWSLPTLLAMISLLSAAWFVEDRKLDTTPEGAVRSAG